MLYGWPIAKLLFLTSAFGFVLLGIQVTLFHYRGNFRSLTMWIPVLSAPTLAGLLLLFALWPAYWLRVLLFWFLCIEVLGGLFGFTRHLHGITQRMGGLKLNNVLTGPPIMLPLLLSFLSLLGLLGLYI
jgi:hypothetical protein